MKKVAKKPVKAVRKKPASERVESPPPAREPPAETVELAAEPTAAEPATTTQSATPVAGARAGLHLEPSCMLRDALDMQFQLISADFGSGDVLMDGSAVQRVDTAGLQLLVAFVQHHKAKGRQVGWSSTSDALGHAARRLGLVDSLNLPRVEESAS